MTTKVISSDNGNATAGIKVSVARPRKTNMTSTTSDECNSQGQSARRESNE